jgi:hypothetical protein
MDKGMDSEEMMLEMVELGTGVTAEDICYEITVSVFLFFY